MSSTTFFDVLVIGAGPAGLSAATTLARHLYTTVVSDSGVCRNALSNHMHIMVAHDHQNPANFREKNGREDLQKRYDAIQFQDMKIGSVMKKENIFKTIDEKGDLWKERKLVLATGVRDIFPDLEGFGECWGRSIFHCLFCDGYEERGVESAGLLAMGDCAPPDIAMHVARMAKRLAKSVTIYTNGDANLSESITGILGKSGIKVDGRQIKKIERGSVRSEAILTLEDGERITEGFVVRILEFCLLSH